MKPFILSRRQVRLANVIALIPLCLGLCIFSCSSDPTINLPQESKTTLYDGSILGITHLEDDQFYIGLDRVGSMINIESEYNNDPTVLCYGEFGRVIGSDPEIHGLILYLHKDHKLSTRIFMKKGGVFQEIPEYNLFVQNISLVHIKAICAGFKMLFPGDQFVNLTLKSGRVPALNTYPDELGIKILANSYRDNVNNSRDLSLWAAINKLYTAAPPCEELPCETGPGSECAVYDEMTYQCLTGICSATRFGGMLLNIEEINNGEYNDLFLNNAYYTLSDSVAVLYDIGDKFVNYYFGLSDFLGLSMGSTNIGVLMELLSNMSDIKAISQALTKSSQINSVPLTSTRVDNLLDLLDTYRGLDSNDDYEFIIDDIKAEIETYEGMTVAQIYAAQ